MFRTLQPGLEYDTVTDTVPELWQFIVGLRPDDLIAELIANEIDAGSTNTVLSFEERRLMCSGNGDPVDDAGWARLSVVRGAGDRVPRKLGLIGVKNHGLKACFSMGDDIYVRSNGRFAHQTLYKNGHGNRPYPGATKYPVADPSAPTGRGTTVEVAYRRRPLVVTQGEPIALATFAPESLESVFRSAVTELPNRLIGTLRPDCRPMHVIELRHHRLGSARFEFRAGRMTRRAGFATFLRTCDGSTDSPTLAVSSIRERAVVSTCSRPGRQSKEVAEFYRADKGLFIEVAWGEDVAGKLASQHGQLRYPIAYAASGSDASSGLAVHYSAPFVSDPERHGLAGGAAQWNSGLTRACDDLLVAAIGKLLIPRAGPKALDILVDPAASPGRTSHLLAMCLAARALPVVGPRATTSDKVGRSRVRPWRRCLVPCFRARPERTAPELAAIAPAGEALLASGVHPAVTTLLASGTLPGYYTNHVVFDEYAALARLQPTAADGSFPWPNEDARSRALANPRIVSKHLDVVAKAVDIAPSGTAGRAAIAALTPKGVVLPDEKGRLWPTTDLRLAAALPRDLPGLKLPPLLHPDLAGHRVFRKHDWNLGTFVFRDFLESLSSSDLSLQTAKALFQWIFANSDKVPANAWSKVRDLQIWPAAGSDVPFKLHELCAPRNASVGQVLGNSLKRPSRSLLKLAESLRRRRVSVPFRSHPNASEIKTWLASRLDVFARDRILTEVERAQFRALEAELATLAAERQLAEALVPLAGGIPALSKAGTLKSAATLVDPKKFALLNLRDVDLLDRTGPAPEALVPPAERPTAAMIIAALRADTQNTSALLARLKALVDLASSGSDQDLGIADVPCIPAHGHFHSPESLAFKGNDGNYWGDWRVEISGAGLSQADQVLYRRAGVLSAEPGPDTSRLFFSWLNANPQLVEKHLPQILRHFAHHRGVSAWWAAFATIPCLPVEGPVGISLIAYPAATAKAAPCFVDDFHELGDVIRQNRMKFLLAVDEHQDVRRPITEALIAAGVKSLRLSAGEPTHVTGGRARQGSAWTVTVLSQFRSKNMAANIQKRIVALGVSLGLMAPRWRGNLQSVTRVNCARTVFATYKLGRQRASASVRQAFDPASGVLWLADRGDKRDMEDAFFEALAGRVFVHGAPQYCAPALERALRISVREAHRPMASPEASLDTGNLEEDEAPPGEAPNAHHNWTPDPAKNMPSPGPLPSNFGSARAPSGRGRTRTKARSDIADEREQALDLKAKHYAWHCQIGLARQFPGALAPKGSYVEHQENRQRLIDAHHPDAVDAGGARHAGNLLILSHLNHHRYGRHISRDQITDALKAGGTPHRVTFASGASSTVVKGVVVEITLPATGSIVPIFFTRWHRDYWLNKAY
jgi:hypothetical protein